MENIVRCPSRELEEITVRKSKIMVTKGDGVVRRKMVETFCCVRSSC